MRTYHTEQRQILLDFLHAHPERAFTVEEMAEALGDTLAKSTLYRLIGRLAEAGEVRRLAGERGRTLRYQALSDSACHTHLHLQCTTCGRLIHLDESTSEAMLHMLDNTDFEVDEGQTLLLGHCRNCR